MIRNIHNSFVHSHSTARAAVRQTANTQAETDSFHNLFAATDTAASATTQQAPITATITKSAAPAATQTITLDPPVFKQNPTTTNPDGSTTPLNWTQFASPQTAQQIAAKLGGAVDEVNIPGFSDSQLSIRVPGSNNLVNAGVAAQLFAQYGDKPGSQAWQIINRDLGRDPMST